MFVYSYNVGLVQQNAQKKQQGILNHFLGGRVNASDRIVTYWDKDVDHWLEWNVPVPTPGAYAVALRYASGAQQALRDCQIDGVSPAEDWRGLAFLGTGGYSSAADNWAWRLLKGADGAILRHELSAGEHTLRLINRGGGMALDAILLVPLEGLSAEQ